MRVLLVEDDALLGEGLVQALQMADYAVDWWQDGESAWQAVAASPTAYAMAVIDWQLPKRDGVSLIGKIREVGYPIPILLLTAKDALADKVRGLDAGADDYLCKPFDLDELLARLRALCRRHIQQHAQALIHGTLTLDPLNQTVHLAGKPIVVSAKEFALLQHLMLHPHRTHSKASLTEALYDIDEDIDSNAIEVHIFNVRKKIGADKIRTWRGMGYALAPLD